MSALAWLFVLSVLGAPLDLLGIDRSARGDGVPAGWKVRAVRGQRAPDAVIAGSGDTGSVLRLSGAGRAAWFYRELSQPLSPVGHLRWSWRAIELPTGADLRDERVDDSPIRVYVVFGTPRRFFGGGERIIFYSYGNAEPVGYAGASHVSSKLHVIRVDGVAERGTWQEHDVEPLADYRRIWHDEPPPVAAVGIMQDTDQTGERAVAEIRRLEWLLP